MKVRNSLCWIWSCGVALLVVMAPAPGAAADEYAQSEPFWMDRPSTGGPRQPALLNLPGSWRGGDAAVLLLSKSTERSPLRDRLIGSLLHVGAAVLELEWSTPVAEAADVEEAAEFIRQGWGTGLLAVIGLGPVGAAAALRVRGPEGHRFVAQVGIAVGTPSFQRGQGPVPSEERWPERAVSFCAALTWALDSGAIPVERGGAAGTEAYGACVAALIPGGAKPSSSRPTGSLRHTPR